MRSRNIKPGFFKNDALVELPFEYRILFIGLWTLADREGRLEDRPKRIKMELFPADNVDVEDGLARLERCGFIERYEANGVKVVLVLNFLRHQSPHHTEKKSELPERNGEITVNLPLNNGDSPEVHASATVNIPLIPDSLIPEKTLVRDSGESRDLSKKPRKQKNAPKFTDDDQTLADRILTAVQTVAPSAKGSPKWPETIRLMRERDGHSHAEIWAMFEFAHRDTFWRTNILSPEKLRAQWVKLEAKRGTAAEPEPEPLEWHQTQSGIFEKARQLGIDPGDDPVGVLKWRILKHLGESDEQARH